jgi:hypothetical protein
MLGVSVGQVPENSRKRIAKYKLYLVAVQEFSWDSSGSKPEDHYTFNGPGNAYHQLGSGFFRHKGTTSAVRTVEFVSD